MDKINFEEWMQRKTEFPAFTKNYFEELERKAFELLANIKVKLPELEAMLEESTSHWGYEDAVYRFYHQSFKVYSLQERTRKILELLYSVAPDGTTINSSFQEILADGMSGKKFEMGHNQEWTKHTRPIVEAFFHARFFLEMAVKYGRELDEAINRLPSGWAALLCLYNIR